MKQRFRQSTAATLRASPQEGPPITSATVEIFEPGGGTLQASTAAVIPTVATAINNASGYSVGTKTLILDDTTGIAADGLYWVGTVGTDSVHQVNVRTIDSATQVQLAEGLSNPVDDDEEFLGSELTYTLTTTHTATLDSNYRVVWTYTVGTQTYIATQLFDVVAQPFALALGPAMLRRYLPDAVRRQAPGLSLQELIRESEAKIIRELRRRDIKPDRVRDMDQFTYLGVLGAREIWQNRQLAVDPDILPSLEKTEEQWNMEFSRIMAAGLSWYDADESLTVGTASDLGEESEEGVQRAKYAVLA